MTPLERAGYLAHAASPAFLRRVAEAKALIAKHSDYGVSVSWGKDSVVLLHLAYTTLADCRAINIRYLHWAERLTDHDRVRDEFLQAYPLGLYHEEPCIGMWELFGQYGLSDDGNKQINRAFDKAFYTAIAHAEQTAGIKGHFVGMRAGESKRRAFNIKMRGKEYTKKNGEQMCLPLAGWSAEDVWAYHVSHNLPHMLIYDMPSENRSRQRSEIALASTYSSMLSAQGEFAAWRRCYPAEYYAWIERWPELGN